MSLSVYCGVFRPSCTTATAPPPDPPVCPTRHQPPQCQSAGK